MSPKVGGFNFKINLCFSSSLPDSIDFFFSALLIYFYSVCYGWECFVKVNGLKLIIQFMLSKNTLCITYPKKRAKVSVDHYFLSEVLHYIQNHIRLLP